MNKDTTIFVSYSHKDETFKDELITQLSGLKRSGYIKSWDDRKILPGEKWNDEIINNLNNANLIIFLVSSDFIASEYIHDIEIKAAKDKSKSGEAVIVPIIIRSCDFENSSLSEFQALPKNAQAIATFENRDHAWMTVVNELKRIIVGNDTEEEEASSLRSVKNIQRVSSGQYIKYALIALVVLTILIVAIIKFNSSETTGIKGNNNNNNAVQIEK